MKNDILLSVIIPIYNTKIEDLEKCIMTVLKQTYKNLEIILVDDGSKTEIADFCDRISLTDERIVVFHNTNHGVSWSRNFGIEKATGNYISFIDSDDILENKMFEILITNVMLEKCDISACGYNYIELDGKIYPKYGSNKKLMYNKEKALVSFFDDDSFGVAIWNKIFSKELVKKIKFNDNLSINEDRLFMFEAIIECSLLVYEDKCLYNYVKRENSATTSTFSKKRLDVLTVNNIIENEIDNLNDLSDYQIIKNKFIKNKCIYLLRLYRELNLTNSKKMFYSETCNIEKQLKKSYKIKNDLNFFDKVELFLIVKLKKIYPVIIKIMTNFTMLKKIKNLKERRNK